MTDKNTCNLSVGDLEKIADGETVGPWVFRGETVYVRMDSSEVEKAEGVDIDD